MKRLFTGKSYRPYRHGITGKHPTQHRAGYDYIIGGAAQPPNRMPQT
ncbi:MAG: hypothetical protein LBJ00_05300 [Planctomycetaceae bacterium]|nr:hypothetical protein [Planctomycetaceae bacterium]